MKVKVPYLQYEIIEKIYENKNVLKKNLKIEGFPENSLIIQNALNSLKQKRIIDSKNKLSNYGLDLIKKYYKIRHTPPTYIDKNFTINTNHLINGGKKENIINDWYNYLEDFDGSFVNESIKKYKIDKKFYILDPFLGSGTTLIQSKLLGFKSLGADTNPAMIFIAQQKLNWDHSQKAILEIYTNLIKKFLIHVDQSKKWLSPLDNMPISEKNQWLSPIKQKEIAIMFNLINKISNAWIKNLFRLILTRSSINTSYVAYCPGTTFYPFRPKPDFLDCFKNLTNQILMDLKDERIIKNKNIVSKIYFENILAKNYLERFNNKVDLVITSPPYPNDLEYTRQTRLELYLLNCVKNMSEVKLIKQNMMKGSTKLIFKDDKINNLIENTRSISRAMKEIKTNLKDKNWGFDYPKMVGMYFSNTLTALTNIKKKLIKNGKCLYVVGDQRIKGIKIPVTEITCELAEIVGFKSTEIKIHRNRRSTTHNFDIPEKIAILTN
jgi:DNA modification methylase